MRDSGITCLVTIHGIGFQQPPGEGTAGYADDLHRNLYHVLNQDGRDLLSDDPERQPYQQGESVPIYVQSVWPPRPVSQKGCLKLGSREEGLSRLGSWDHHDWTVLGSDAPLTTGGNTRIAHVALVYSGLEGRGPQVVPALETGAMLAFYGHRYRSFTGLLKMLFQDLAGLPVNALLAKIYGDRLPLRPSLRIRQDECYARPRALPRKATGSFALLRQLENDVAAYVCQNMLRQRVRSFVLEALIRLAAREDVAGIVLNTHSNGTVVGLDALQELPPFAAQKIRAVITAGSPLRKYVDLFVWGKYLMTVPKISCWWNFWDRRDIVADRLLPYARWRGDHYEKLTKRQLVGIYQALDPYGNITPMPIKDIEVNNRLNSPRGGLPAHNYWDNREEFIPRVASLLREVVDTGCVNDETFEHVQAASTCTHVSHQKKPVFWPAWA